MIEEEIDHHPSHPGYKLKQENMERPYTCDGCKELGFGTCYTCTNTACNFHLHKDCVHPEEIISHSFFPNLYFHFLKEGLPNRYCDACGKDINGYVYHCYDGGYDLHPCCAKLPHVFENVVTDEGDELNLVLRKKVSSKCYKCGKKKLSKEVKNTWSYVSEKKKVHFHVCCVKDMVCESWKESLQIEKVDACPKLKVKLYKEGKWIGSGSKFGKLKTVLKLALTFAIAAVIGDPTAMVVALFLLFGYI
ncbi:putative chromatin regulator PHD family [Dioscorea sansibarensis]